MSWLLTRQCLNFSVVGVSNGFLEQYKLIVKIAEVIQCTSRISEMYTADLDLDLHVSDSS